MKIQRFQKRAKVERTKYSIRGIVEVLDGNSILIRKSNSNTRFWIDKNEQDISSLSLGDEADFTVIINTYISTLDERRMIRAKLRLIEFDNTLEELDEGEEFKGGDMTVLVKNVIRSEISGLFLLHLMREDSGERIWVRYYNEDMIPPTTDIRYTAKLNLIKSKTTIAADGKIYEGTEERVRVDEDGVETLATYPVYSP